MMGKYHNVLYIGMKVAWEWGVTDSAAIKELLGRSSALVMRILDRNLPRTYNNVVFVSPHNS